MLTPLFQFAQKEQASDLHLTTDRPAFMRKQGDLIQITRETINHEKLIEALYRMISPDEISAFEKQGSLDFATSISLQSQTLRLRGHYFKNTQGMTAVFRLIRDQKITLDEIHAPAIFKKLIKQRNGLILITGATGSGKSTTLSALIHEINQTQCRHIITIEDPIEFIYQSENSLIEQRELSEHTSSFPLALKDALRADPDIIVIGELRDKESVNLALQAAETGHLVISTLHTSSAAKTIHRLLSFFPINEHDQLRIQIAELLNATIAQSLINIDTQRYALFEVLTVNSAIANLIREHKIAQIESNIQTGSTFGMQTFQQHLEFLKKSGILSDLLAEKAQNLL